jgi:uncharacterized protein YukE
MNDDINQDDEAYQRAQAQIADVHDELVRAQRTATSQVRSLLGRGWTGVAAREYAEGWDDWESGCDLVLDGLAGMNAALTSASLALHHSDGAQAAAMAWLDQRLGGGA